VPLFVSKGEAGVNGKIFAVPAKMFADPAKLVRFRYIPASETLRRAVYGGTAGREPPATRTG
jgi:hypothetical protein